MLIFAKIFAKFSTGALAQPRVSHPPPPHHAAATSSRVIARLNGTVKLNVVPRPGRPGPDARRIAAKLLTLRQKCRFARG